MSFEQRQTRQTAGTLALLMLSAAVAAGAQYSTPVGTGAAKPKTLRATAVLEWTGSLEKPNASRLMPIAVWDGEHYQPAGLYLARPAPLAFETGTQYQLERSGEPAGLFNVRGAAQLGGDWIGMGKFQAQAAPPPPPKLKPSKHLPVLSTGMSDSTGSSGTTNSSDRPTLHRKSDDSGTSSPVSGNAPPATSSSSSSGSASPAGQTSSQSKPADTSSPASSDPDKPTLHRRSDPNSSSTSTPDGSSTTTGTTPDTGSSTTGSADDDRPTLHRRTDSTGTSAGSANTPDVDPDRPTLHRQSGTNSTGTKDEASDPDRPTLHRARSGGDAAAAIDPDRPHLRYGRSDDAGSSVLPARLEGAPPSMQQIVAVSDSATGDPRPYRFHWPEPDDATKMQAALAAIAAQAVARPTAAAAKPPAQFGPASRAAARKTRAAHVAPLLPTLVDEHFTAYELSFSGGATLVYSAHTAAEGAQRIYVTLIAQPDFSGKPQVLLQQVARADRLDETPALQLVDALDTDNDQRAELIFQLNGASTTRPIDNAPAPTDPPETTPAAGPSSTAPTPVAMAEREFAIYRVANGKAVQVFNTGPLP